MKYATSDFTRELLIHFPKRFDTEADEDAWTRAMTDALRGVSGDVLKRAATKIINTRKETRFPLPRECRDAVAEVIADDERARSAALVKDPTKHAGTDYRYRLADELIHCELGRRAAREGWIISLHDYVRRHGELPRERWQIEACIKSARGCDEAYETILRACNGRAPARIKGTAFETLGGAGLNAALARLGDAFMRKRERYRAIVLGETR